MNHRETELTYDFNGIKVKVDQGQKVIVATSLLGDCVTQLADTPKVRQQIARGIWDESFIYELSADKPARLLVEPRSKGGHIQFE